MEQITDTARKRRKRAMYPGTKEAELERVRSSGQKVADDTEPDWIAGCPNYDKFNGWDAEHVLVWLNID